MLTINRSPISGIRTIGLWIRVEIMIVTADRASVIGTAMANMSILLSPPSMPPKGMKSKSMAAVWNKRSDPEGLLSSQSVLVWLERVSTALLRVFQ